MTTLLKRMDRFLLVCVLISFVVWPMPASASAGAHAPLLKSDLKTLFPEGARRSDWYGIYMAGRKVGYAVSWSKDTPPTATDGGGYVVGLELTMKVYGGGASDHVRMNEVRHYSRMAPYRLVHATYEQRSSKSVDVRTYRKDGGRAKIERRINGLEQDTVTIPLSKESLSDQVSTWVVAGGKPRYKGLHRGWSFMWDLMKDITYTATARGNRTELVAGLKLGLTEFEVTHQSMGLTGTMSVMDGGRVLSMGIGSQMVLRLEEQEVARGQVEGLDVATAGVSIRGAIHDPAQLKELELRVALPKENVLASRGARLKARCDKSTCHVRIARAPGAKVTALERKEALKSDHAIDHHVALVRKTAQRIAGERVGGARVHALLNYVYRSLKKRLATNLPSASTVLEAGYGDCTEHTWLFVALARALGIPARPVYGLAYVAGENARFAYHAWVEVEMDGHWVEVDPTWGQKQADVGHLILGEDSNAIAAFFGGLQIDLVQGVD